MSENISGQSNEEVLANDNVPPAHVEVNYVQALEPDELLAIVNRTTSFPQHVRYWPQSVEEARKRGLLK